MRRVKVTAIIDRHEDGSYVSICPELQIASQGTSREEARRNLISAMEGFLETVSEAELNARLHPDRYVESVEVTVN